MKYSFAVACLLANSLVNTEDVTTPEVADETTELRRSGGSRSSYIIRPATRITVIRTLPRVAVAVDGVIEGDSAKDNFNAGVDATIASMEDAVPQVVSYGDKTMEVNQDAVRDMMETERRFW